MDYVPALSLLTWALVLLLEERHALSAVLIGLACGFRPLSGAFALPAMLLVLLQTKSYRRALAYFAIALAFGAACYSPVLLKYGFISNPIGAETTVGAKLLRAGYRAFQVFGALQTALVVLLLASTALARSASISERFRAPGTGVSWFHLANVFLWLSLFLYRPEEPEYLLPAVPSAILLLDTLLSRRTFLVALLVLSSYHFVRLELLGGTSGARRVDLSIGPGFTISDIQQRLFSLCLRDVATNYRPSRPTVLMYGVEYIAKANHAWKIYRWDSRIEAYQQRDGQLVVSSLVKEKDVMAELFQSGFTVVGYSGHLSGLDRSESESAGLVIVDDLRQLFGDSRAVCLSN
jgi:hypothetical protein